MTFFATNHQQRVTFTCRRMETAQDYAVKMLGTDVNIVLTLVGRGTHRFYVNSKWHRKLPKDA